MGGVESTLPDNSYRQTKNVQNLKQHKAEEWEIHIVGDLLLRVLSSNDVAPDNNWMVKKSDLRKEFIEFTTAELRGKFKELNGTDNIGTILYRCGFLRHTPRGSPYYELKSKDYIQRVMNHNNREMNIRQNETPRVSKSKDMPQLEELNKAMQEIDVKYKRNENNKTTGQRNVQGLKLNDFNTQSINNNMENGTSYSNDRKDEYNEPATSEAVMKINLHRNSEEDLAKINKKYNLEMIFDELPRVPKFELTIQHEEKNQQQRSEIVTPSPKYSNSDQKSATKLQQQYEEECNKNLQHLDEFNKNRNTIDILSSPLYSNSDREASIQVQQQNVDKEYNKKIQQEEIEEGECAKEFQQKLEFNKCEYTTEILTFSTKYSNADREPLTKVQQQYEDEENKKKLQQELGDEEYARQLQQKFEDEHLEKQNAQQIQPITTETPNTIPSSPPPQPQKTDDEIFKDRMFQLETEKSQYSDYIRKVRSDHNAEQIRYNDYKFNWGIPHDKEYENYWKQQRIKYDQEEDDYEKFKREHHFKREELLDQYDEYKRQKRRREGRAEECSIQ